MEAASPRERPVRFVISETGSRLTMRKRFVRVTGALFVFYNQLGGTFRTDIDLATGAGKTIAAMTVGEVPLDGSTTIVTKDYFNQFVHKEDDDASLLLHVIHPTAFLTHSPICCYCISQ